MDHLCQNTLAYSMLLINMCNQKINTIQTVPVVCYVEFTFFASKSFACWHAHLFHFLHIFQTEHNNRKCPNRRWCSLFIKLCYFQFLFFICVEKHHQPPLFISTFQYHKEEHWTLNIERKCMQRSKRRLAGIFILYSGHFTMHLICWL